MSTIQEIENLLRPPEIPLKPYESKYVGLATGEKLVIREASKEEAPLLIEAIKPLFTVERDYYDVVSARVHAELLAWYRNRIANMFCIIGTINGELVGLVTSRAYDEKRGMSLHTLALRRGRRVGAHLFASKMQHHIENLGEEDVYITVESPVGFRRWVVEWGLASKEEGFKHELGGARSWVMTRDIYFKGKPKLVFGKSPIPEDLLAASYKLKIIVPDVAEER